MEGPPFDFLPLVQDGLCPPEVDVGGREIAEALVVAPVVVVIDEGLDLRFEITRQIVVFEQDAVLQGLMPALDLALGLGMIGRSADVADAMSLEPFGYCASSSVSFFREQTNLKPRNFLGSRSMSLAAQPKIV